MISRGKKGGWKKGRRSWEEGELENTRESRSDKEGERKRSKFVGSWCQKQPKIGNL